MTLQDFTPAGGLLATLDLLSISQAGAVFTGVLVVTSLPFELRFFSLLVDI